MVTSLGAGADTACRATVRTPPPPWRAAAAAASAAARRPVSLRSLVWANPVVSPTTTRIPAPRSRPDARSSTRPSSSRAAPARRSSANTSANSPPVRKATPRTVSTTDSSINAYSCLHWNSSRVPAYRENPCLSSSGPAATRKWSSPRLTPPWRSPPATCRCWPRPGWCSSARRRPWPPSVPCWAGDDHGRPSHRDHPPGPDRGGQHGDRHRHPRAQRRTPAGVQHQRQRRPRSGRRRPGHPGPGRHRLVPGEGPLASRTRSRERIRPFEPL